MDDLSGLSAGSVVFNSPSNSIVVGNINFNGNLTDTLFTVIDNQQYDKAFTQLNTINQKNNKTALQELLIKTILSWIKIEKDKLNFYEANNLFDKLIMIVFFKYYIGNF